MNETDASIVEKLLPMVNAVYITEHGLDCRALLKLLIAKNLITKEEFAAAKKAEYETKDGRALQETKRELEAVFGAGFFDEDDDDARKLFADTRRAQLRN